MLVILINECYLLNVEKRCNTHGCFTSSSGHPKFQACTCVEFTNSQINMIAHNAHVLV